MRRQLLAAVPAALALVTPALAAETEPRPGTGASAGVHASLGGGVPAAGGPPRLHTADGHFHADHGHGVRHDAATEADLRRSTLAATAADAAVAAAAVAATPQDVGQWGPLVPWPVVAMNTALLPDGRVLAYDSVGDQPVESYSTHNFTRATVWDPRTGTHTRVDARTGYNLFCSGLAHLVDGRLFVAGGNRNATMNGIPQTHLFSASSGWQLGPTMARDRWYPSVTPLANGEMLITEGGPNTPEVRSTGGTLRELTGASLSLPLYPWLDVAPDGRTFYSGPDNRMLSLDTSGAGAWRSLGSGDGNRDYGSRAVFDVGRILVAGGGASRRDAAVIDIRGTTPTRAATGPMATGRRQHNLTVLADGSVLAIGGNSSGADLVDRAAGVYSAERWNPATGQWRTLAAQRQTRQYHSTATLLPDGRVLSAGGGICGDCARVGYLAKDAEVFSPPYLFDSTGALARRPTISSAPPSVALGGSFTVSTPDAASIRKVALVRLGAQTHSTEMEQRYVPLRYTAGTGSLTVTAPAGPGIAPPGAYMLFLVDAAGVPSVASMTTVTAGGTSTNVPPTVRITSPASGTSLPRGSTVTITADAADSDGRVTRVQFFRDGGVTLLGEDTTAPYSFTWTSPPSSSYWLRAAATDDKGAVTRSTTVNVVIQP